MTSGYELAQDNQKRFYGETEKDREYRWDEVTPALFPEFFNVKPLETEFAWVNALGNEADEKRYGFPYFAIGSASPQQVIHGPGQGPPVQDKQRNYIYTIRGILVLNAYEKIGTLLYIHSRSNPKFRNGVKYAIKDQLTVANTRYNNNPARLKIAASGQNTDLDYTLMLK